MSLTDGVDSSSALINKVNAVDISSVDWQQVASLDPINVKWWILHLHEHEYPEIQSLFRSMWNEEDSGIDVIEDAHWTHPWKVYEECGVLCVLLELISEPDMFSDKPDAFKSIPYSLRVLSLLVHFLATLKVRHSRGDTRIKNTLRELVCRMVPFGNAMWSNRNLIHTTPSYADQTIRNFLALSRCAVAAMAEIYQLETGNMPPFPTYAAQFLLYSWTYSARKDWLMHVHALQYFRQMTLASPESIPDFIKQHATICHSRYIQDILEKIAGLLQDDYVLDNEASMTAVLCTNIANYAAQSDSTAISYGPILVNLMPSLIKCCQRQLCSSRTEDANMTLSALLHTFTLALAAGGPNPKLNEIAVGHFVKSASKLNLLAIIGRVLLDGLVERPQSLLPTMNLLKRLTAVARRSSSLKQHLKSTSRGVWHDTLNTLLYTSSARPIHSHMQNLVGQAWVEYGNLFGWKVGKLVASTANQPSKPSDDACYWRIPRHCFSNACPCSTHRASHQMRVCKGCFRVLYCSPMCQQSDWKAGHRLLCKRLGSS